MKRKEGGRRRESRAPNHTDVSTGSPTQGCSAALSKKVQNTHSWSLAMTAPTVPVVLESVVVTQCQEQGEQQVVRPHQDETRAVQMTHVARKSADRPKVSSCQVSANISFQRVVTPETNGKKPRAQQKHPPACENKLSFFKHWRS